MQNCKIIYHNPNNIAQDEIKKVVIWLHGLGANGHDFVPIVPELGLTMAVKFIFPHAPSIPVTINGGYVMPAWYDILEMSDISRKVDTQGIQNSTDRILDIIKTEMGRGVALKDIVIAGFSQGGAVAYHTAMSVDGLGGLMALSTYFATESAFKQGVKAQKSLPIFIAHGEYDDVVSPRFSAMAVDVLGQWGFAPERHSYTIAHQVSLQEISDIGVWLTKVFAES